MLLDWINDELADHRIIVKDIEEDLFDGQILQKLIGLWLTFDPCPHFKVHFLSIVSSLAYPATKPILFVYINSIIILFCPILAFF